MVFDKYRNEINTPLLTSRDLWVPSYTHPLVFIIFWLFTKGAVYNNLKGAINTHKLTTTSLPAIWYAIWLYDPRGCFQLLSKCSLQKVWLLLFNFKGQLKHRKSILYFQNKAWFIATMFTLSTTSPRFVPSSVLQ